MEISFSAKIKRVSERLDFVAEDLSVLASHEVVLVSTAMGRDDFLRLARHCNSGHNVEVVVELLQGELLASVYGGGSVVRIPIKEGKDGTAES